MYQPFRLLIFRGNRRRLFGLGDVKALTDLIIGSVLETADIEALVTKHGSDIRLQAKGRKSADDISQGLHTQLLSAGAKLKTFDVENIYEANSQGDQNVQAWLNAEQIDHNTKAQIKEVGIRSRI